MCAFHTVFNWRLYDAAASVQALAGEGASP